MRKTFWHKTARTPRYPALRRHLEVDVAIIGAGITGLSAAQLLKRDGKSVAVLERDRIAFGDTGHTTAHLTMVTDLPLQRLVRRLGKDHARAVWEAGDAALGCVRELVCSLEIACDFRAVPAFVHAPLRGKATPSQRKMLRAEAATARQLGFDVDYLGDVPGVHRPGIQYANQAILHPLKYVAGLAREIPGRGCNIYEGSEVIEVLDNPLRLRVNGREVRCEHLVIATHVPLMGKTGILKATLFQTKIAPYSTYAIGARLPRGTFPEASYFDTSDPYYYLRVEARRGHDYAILGGEDHKTGQKDRTRACFASLARMMKSIAPAALIESQWSGQVIETADGLPLIGESSPNQFIATGFAGNGMTFGSLAGMMAADAVAGRKNPWAQLFHPHRKQFRGGTWNYIRENLDYPYYLVKGRLARSEQRSIRSVKPGEGVILRINGTRAAVYRNADGQISKRSPSCTHMGCFVHWNTAEQTWDCPCHGSRFHPTGEVLAGPAETPLADRS